VLLILCNFILQSSSVQTWLTTRASNWLSQQLGTAVTIGKVDIDLWAHLILEDVYIEDNHSDTLAFLPVLKLRKYNFYDQGSSVQIGDAVLERPYFNLKKYSADTVFNYSHILNYIESISGSQDSSATSVALKHLAIVDAKLLYTNETRASKTDFGIDWNHLVLFGYPIGRLDLRK
jgi:hypothetical protein